jgi:hypothetical protein
MTLEYKNILSKLINPSWLWSHVPVMAALGRYRQEDQEFKASLGYIETDSVLKNPNKQKQKQNNPQKFSEVS